MNLSSDDSVLRLTHEGSTNFVSLSDFDNKIIQKLPSVCKNNIPAIEVDATNIVAAEVSVSGSNISSISIRMLIASVNASNCYGSIARAMDLQTRACKCLRNFQDRTWCFLSIKDDDDSKVPNVNNIKTIERLFVCLPCSRTSSQTFMDHVHH